MLNTRVLVSVFEFALAVGMSGLVIYLTYKVFIKANPDFDMEEEIKKGNVAVGTLMAAILFSASMILQKGMSSVLSMFRLYMSAPGENNLGLGRLSLPSLGHPGIPLLAAVITISVTLRLFAGSAGRSTPAGSREASAIGILLVAWLSSRACTSGRRSAVSGPGSAALIGRSRSLNRPGQRT